MAAVLAIDGGNSTWSTLLRLPVLAEIGPFAPLGIAGGAGSGNRIVPRFGLSDTGWKSGEASAAACFNARLNWRAVW
ncbi:MAG: hypothetical protein WBM50_26510 [Acidimicrobiales bacterium]